MFRQIDAVQAKAQIQWTSVLNELHEIKIKNEFMKQKTVEQEGVEQKIELDLMGGFKDRLAQYKTTTPIAPNTPSNHLKL